MNHEKLLYLMALRLPRKQNSIKEGKKEDDLKSISDVTTRDVCHTKLDFKLILSRQNSVGEFAKRLCLKCCNVPP